MADKFGMLGGTDNTAPLKPGESRTFMREDRTTWTLHRTERPYQYDLADAYTASLRERGNRSMMWAAFPNGDLKLVSTRDWSPPKSELVPPR